MRLSDLERPFVCTSLTESTVEETVRALKTADYVGSRALEVHLPLLGLPNREGMGVLEDGDAGLHLEVLVPRSTSGTIRGSGSRCRRGGIQRKRTDHLVGGGG